MKIRVVPCPRNAQLLGWCHPRPWSKRGARRGATGRLVVFPGKPPMTGKSGNGTVWHGKHTTYENADAWRAWGDGLWMFMALFYPQKKKGPNSAGCRWQLCLLCVSQNSPRFRGTLRFHVEGPTFNTFKTPSGNLNGVAMGCHGTSSPGLTVTWPCLHNKTWLPCSWGYFFSSSAKASLFTASTELKAETIKLRNSEFWVYHIVGSVQLFPPWSAQCTPCVTSDHEIMKCLICAWHWWDCPKMGYPNNLRKYHGYCIHHLIIIVPYFPNWNGHFVVSSWGFPVLPGDAESVIESRRLRASCHCSPSSHQQGQQNWGKKQQQIIVMINIGKICSNTKRCKKKHAAYIYII